MYTHPNIDLRTSEVNDSKKGGNDILDVLVLNNTYQALNITSIERAVKLIFAGKAEIVHAERRNLHAAVFEMPMPSIIRMLYYIKYQQQGVSLSKHNVILRDKHKCQYCDKKFPRELLTVDHVVPKSKGGPSRWDNLVAACQRCNNRKNDRTPEDANMTLLRKPKQPRYIPWIRVRAAARNCPSEWKK